VQLSGGTLLLDTTPFALSGIALTGSYTGRFYNLDPNSGSDGSFALLDSLAPIETVNTGITAINFPSSAGNPFESVMTNGGALTVDDHAARFTGQINVTAAQNISFFTNSDDGSILWVDLNNDGDFNDANEEVVDNRGLHGMQVRTGSRFLPVGNYNIRVDQFERGGGSGLIAGWQGVPEFANNVSVTANSTINVGGTAGAATLGNISLNSGVTLTIAGSALTAGDLTTGGNGTLNVGAGGLSVASISDGANSGTLTKSGAGTLTARGAGDLSGTTLNITGGAVNALAAGSLSGAVAINASDNAGLRVGHADAVSASTPITVGRGSFVDFDAPLTSSRKITVDALGAVIGQLDNLSYGTGPNQVSLVNNSVLGPDVGETNLPAPGPAGNRLLLGITANSGTYTHGGETSTGPADLYRGVAIGGWTQPGPLGATLAGPAGGPLNIEIVAPPALRPGNVTFKNISPLTTQFNPGNGVVNMNGQGRVFIDAGGAIGGSWTVLNRTGDPEFLGANNALLETPANAVFEADQTVNLRHGSYNLAGSAAGGTAVQGIFNVLEGGTLVLDDTLANSPSTGTYNIAGAAGTTLDLDGNGSIGPGETSVGPGAIWTNQNNQNSVGAGATFNVAPGFLLVWCWITTIPPTAPGRTLSAKPT
jgi:hypothetical protein